MNIVMTLMVRDEADIVAAMLTHHRAQGVDHVIVTDNASVDGTFDILREFERDGFITLRSDPEHRKQQGRVVTAMAREAATRFSADWVINGDADEFLVPTTSGRTVREILADVGDQVDVLHVPVVNLTGAPARSGSGLRRLVLRDHRPEEEIRRAGIPFHPTPNAVHRGHPEVTVSQGNHQATAPGWHPPLLTTELEVLHLPWRSWTQYEYKVRVSGEAYEANPDLAPSPRHHGMLDYRRLREGRLEEMYVGKHPTEAEAAEGLADGRFVLDERLAGLADHVDPVHDDVLYTAQDRDRRLRLGRAFRAVEFAGEAEADRIRQWHDLAIAQRDSAQEEVTELRRQLEQVQSRRVVKIADRVGTWAHALRSGRSQGAHGGVDQPSK